MNSLNNLYAEKKYQEANEFLKIKLDIDKVVENQTELDKVINQQSPIHSIGEYRKILNLIKNVPYIIEILKKYNVENLKELRAFYSHINNNFYKKYRQNEELNDFFCAGEETLDNLKDLLTEEERQSFWNK